MHFAFSFLFPPFFLYLPPPGSLPMACSMAMTLFLFENIDFVSIRTTLATVIFSHSSRRILPDWSIR
uniref:Secreted protein n=1 Tax=Arundo donax TaxID=35708 RepID=A0A0A9A866_ARUDO